MVNKVTDPDAFIVYSVSKSLIENLNIFILAFILITILNYCLIIPHRAGKVSAVTTYTFMLKEIFLILLSLTRICLNFAILSVTGIFLIYSILY